MGEIGPLHEAGNALASDDDGSRAVAEACRVRQGRHHCIGSWRCSSQLLPAMAGCARVRRCTPHRMQVRQHHHPRQPLIVARPSDRHRRKGCRRSRGTRSAAWCRSPIGLWIHGPPCPRNREVVEATQRHEAGRMQVPAQLRGDGATPRTPAAQRCNGKFSHFYGS